MLTVNDPRVLAPLDRWEGRVAASWQLGGDVVLRVEVLELLVVVRPGLEVMNVAGELVRQAFDVVDDRREDLQYQEHHQRQREQVDEQNRQHLRHQALVRATPSG